MNKINPAQKTINSQEYCADASCAQVSKCAFCGKMFLHQEECANHEKTCDKFYVLPETVLLENPESPKEKKAFQCQFCSRAFTLNKNCNRHEKICFKNDNPFSGFLCEHCGLSFKRKDNFKIHKKRCEESHSKQLNAVPSSSGEETGVEGQPDAEPSSSGEETGVEKQPYKPKARTPCLNPDCDEEFFHKRHLINHLKESHKYDVKDPISKLFDSVEEFLAWKDEIQEKTFSYFSQKSGPFSQHQKKYYYCQHDGISRYRRKTSRTNLKGRVKVGHRCIAKMEAWKESSGKISVLYFSTHSHVCASADFVHHPVSKENNDFINKMLALSVPPRKILDAVLGKDIPKTFNSEEIKNCKSSVLSIKRIRERARKAQEKKRYHKDEAIAIYLMVEKLSKEDKCVVLYKPYKSDVKIGPKEIDELQNSEELFMLGIQTERQAQLMAEHCHKEMLVDETHGTNHHKYQLLSIMVVDDNRKGWPVGHLITSKNDEESIQYFFKAVKERVQKLVPDEKFKINCEDDDPWIFHNFPHAQVNTTGHIESFHHRLKKVKLNRKVNRRLDDLVNFLLELEWDDHLTRTREATSHLDENLTYLSDFLKISHNASALSHAASVMRDLVLQLKYMTEEDKKENVKDIVHMEPAVQFSYTETLKTQLSQISDFKKPLLKRKGSKQARVSPMKKQCVIKDLLTNCTEDEAGTDKPHQF